MDVKTLSDHDLEQLRRAVQREQAARRQADTSPERITESIKQYQRASGRRDGDAWENPVNALQVYMEGDEVEHAGKEWISTHDNNAAEPGVSGWRLKPELDEDGEEIPPPFVRPSGQHDAYEQGQRITWTDGNVYEANRDGVDWDPGNAPGDWALVEEESEPPEDDEEPVKPDPEPEPEPEPEPGPDPGDGDGGDGGESGPDEPEPGTIDNPLVWSGDSVEYKVDQYIAHNGVVYRVQQAHTSQAGWLPPDLPALYEPVGKG